MKYTIWLLALGMIGLNFKAEAQGSRMVCIPEKLMTQGQDQKLMHCRAHFAYTTKPTYKTPSNRCYVQFEFGDSFQSLAASYNTFMESPESIIMAPSSFVGAQVKAGKITGFASKGAPWFIKFSGLNSAQVNQIKYSQQLLVSDLSSYLNIKPIMATSPCDLLSKLPLLENCKCDQVIKSPECKNADICFVPSL